MPLVILGFTPFAAALAVAAGLAWGEAGASTAGGGRAAGPACRMWVLPMSLGLLVALAAAVAAALAIPEGNPQSPAGAAIRAALLVGATGLLAAAIYGAARSIGAAPAAGLGLASLAAALLVATPFYMNPIIERADSAGRGFWIALTAGANPFLVLVHDAAGIDPLRAPLLYDVSICQYYAYAYPSAWPLIALYAVTALGLSAAAAGIRWVRERRPATGGMPAST
jgi:hypothetical protein